MSVSAFVINLEKDVDRLAAITARLNASGISLRRRSAVQGMSVPAPLDEQFKQAISRMCPGEIGRYASHLVCAQQLLDSDRDWVLVLEDDATFEPRASEVIEAAATQAPTGWDLISQCSRSRRSMLSVAGLPHGSTLVRYSRYPWGTTGYLLSRNGARKMLTPRLRLIPIGSQMRQPWTLALDAYGVYPPPISKAQIASSIDGIGGGAMRLVHNVPKVDVGGLLWYTRTLGLIGVARCAVASALSPPRPDGGGNIVR